MRKLPSVHCSLPTGTALLCLGLSGDRTCSQLSSKRFPYTSMKMELDHEKLDVFCTEIVYEYGNVNGNDYAITKVKPEQALRDPRHHASLIINGGSRGRSPSKRRFTACHGVGFKAGRNQPYLLSRRAKTGMSVLQSAAREKTTHCSLITLFPTARLGGLSPTFAAEKIRISENLLFSSFIWIKIMVCSVDSRSLSVLTFKCIAQSGEKMRTIFERKRTCNVRVRILSQALFSFICSFFSRLSVR
jgi:hypothetical protein